MDDEIDRRSIMARRAALIAATMLGLASPSCNDDTGPDDGSAGHQGTGGDPQPCLSPPLGGGGAIGTGGGGGADEGGAGVGGGAVGGAGGEGGMPQPCLVPRK